ncbi:MAG: hypothetical protein JWN14_110, partial [Chthonomonadales bacterium]|nr:hypothetical protein [Chthonomonadales bacterium]
MTVGQVVASLCIQPGCRRLRHVGDIEFFDGDKAVPIYDLPGLLMVEVVAS